MNLSVSHLNFELFSEEYLNQIPYQRIKYETEALKIVKTLDAFANRLNFMLKITSKRNDFDKNDDLAKTVVQSIKMILTSVQKLSLGMYLCALCE